MAGGCGCGGSKRADRPAIQRQQAQRRDGVNPTAHPPVSYSDEGFTWTGPVRPAPQPAKP